MIVREQNRVFRKEPFLRWSESFINSARANRSEKQTTAVILVVVARFPKRTAAANSIRFSRKPRRFIKFAVKFYDSLSILDASIEHLYICTRRSP